MKYAIVFRKHVGPIQSSLQLHANKENVDVLITDRSMEKPPSGYFWDDYDALLWFNNKPPTIKTEAALLWWMCDLRAPSTLGGTTTATHIGLCNKLFLGEYAEYYGVPVTYVPQCGNDTAIFKGRDLKSDVLFLGHVRNLPDKCHAQSEEAVRQQILTKNFHWNRAPIIQHLQSAGLNVKVLSREGATEDSKWLYQQAPISLSISLPATGYSSNRLYNILSSGGFCLALYFPGIEEFFDNHKHLVWFKSKEEAEELTRYYLAKPEERSKIQIAGHEEYLRRHTASHRVSTMLEAIL